MKKAPLLTGLLLFCFAGLKAQPPCAIPDPLFIDDTIIVCNASTTTLTVPVVAGGTYVWSTGEGTNSINITFGGTYHVQVSDATCLRRDTVTVLFNSFALSPIVGDYLRCLNSAPITLQAEGQNLLWYTGPIGGTGSTSPIVAPTNVLGRDTFWVSQTIRGCETPRSMIEVRIITRPYFELGPDFIIPCGTPGIVLTVERDEFSDYLWSTGSTDISVLAPQRGTYHLYAENMCGTWRDTVKAIECEDKCVQFPSAFTPNGDSRNEVFRAYVSCPVSYFRLVVYNKMGVRMFETKDPTGSWNGMFNGKHQPMDVYVYYAEYYDFVLKQYLTKKGTISLLR